MLEKHNGHRVFGAHLRHHLWTGIFQLAQKYVTDSEFLEWAETAPSQTETKPHCNGLLGLCVSGNTHDSSTLRLTTSLCRTLCLQTAAALPQSSETSGKTSRRRSTIWDGSGPGGEKKCLVLGQNSVIHLWTSAIYNSIWYFICTYIVLTGRNYACWVSATLTANFRSRSIILEKSISCKKQ